MVEPLLLGCAAFVLVVTMTLFPVGAVPVGVLLGTYTLVADQRVVYAALIGAAAISVGRASLAITAARRAEHDVPEQVRRRRRALGRQIGSTRQYRKASFAIGAMPLAPARAVFPLLGRIGAPLRWIVLGTIAGQFLLLTITTTLAIAVARLFTDNDRDAATLLGVVAAALVLLGTLRHSDEPGGRESVFQGMFGFDLDGASAGSWQDPTATSDSGTGDGDVIEGAVVGEESLDLPDGTESGESQSSPPMSESDSDESSPSDA